jgi:hypothetical protein
MVLGASCKKSKATGHPPNAHDELDETNDDTDSWKVHDINSEVKQKIVGSSSLMLIATRSTVYKPASILEFWSRLNGATCRCC